VEFINKITEDFLDGTAYTLGDQLVRGGYVVSDITPSQVVIVSTQADALKGAIDSVELFRGKIRVHNNFAIAMYYNKIVYIGKTFRIRCTDVWMKESNKWQLVATTRDFCNNLPRCPGSLD
jgi:hypothetical protein